LEIEDEEESSSSIKFFSSFYTEFPRLKNRSNKIMKLKEEGRRGGWPRRYDHAANCTSKDLYQPH